VIAGQLQLDFEHAENGNGSLDHDELVARIRAQIIERGMSDEEAAAALEDALARLGISRPTEATSARPCVCENGSLLLDALAVDRTCARCGREPRR
jgi:hypothetical protein